jgi:hypothetical protein
MSTMLDHVGAAFVEIENLLIAEIIAGNTVRGLASRLCGRVALGMACTIARLINAWLLSAAALTQFAQQ